MEGWRDGGMGFHCRIVALSHQDWVWEGSLWLKGRMGGRQQAREDAPAMVQGEGLLGGTVSKQAGSMSAFHFFPG